MLLDNLRHQSTKIYQGFLRVDGTRQHPATALVCSFSKPTPKQPCLLHHDELVLLFHELGHGIHDLVAKTKYARFHGFQTVVDFGEAPSQMLENWCWTPTVLKNLSKHYSYLTADYLRAWIEEKKDKIVGDLQPPEKMPDSMIDSLIRAKQVNSSIYNMVVVHLSLFDMKVHAPWSHEEIQDLNTSSAFNNLRNEILPIDGPELLGQGADWGHGEATFGHLMGGYHAAFYSYL
jgi:metallopeptidase MepB